MLYRHRPNTVTAFAVSTETLNDILEMSKDRLFLVQGENDMLLIDSRTSEVIYPGTMVVFENGQIFVMPSHIFDALFEPLIPSQH